jgi:hypothetical protein
MPCWIMSMIVGLLPLAPHLHPEAFYQQQWCNQQQGVLEYRLDDGARVDCVTDSHAIEFDFAPKWAESIGQALYYGAKTGKKSGVVLIMERGDHDQKYLTRLRAVAGQHGIDIWTVAP